MRVLPFILAVFLYSCTLTVPKEVEVKFDEIPEKVDFNYHVKPILSDRCYSCHGPDEKSRRAGLRLDLEKTAFMQLSSGKTAIEIINFILGNSFLQFCKILKFVS